MYLYPMMYQPTMDIIARIDMTPLTTQWACKTRPHRFKSLAAKTCRKFGMLDCQQLARGIGLVNFAWRVVRACRTAWGSGVAREGCSGRMTHETPEMFAARGMFWLALVVVVQAVTSVSCVEVNGGAVELSWSVRTFDGKRVDEDCDNADSKQ